MGMTPIDLDVLEAVLAEQIGPHAVADIFAAYDEAMRHTAAPPAAPPAGDAPPYGLTDTEQDSLIRLACATADEHELRPDPTGTAYWRALASYTDAFAPDGVHTLAARTWQIIEQS